MHVGRINCRVNASVILCHVNCNMANHTRRCEFSSAPNLTALHNIHTCTHTHTHTHKTKLSDNGTYIMHVTTYSYTKIRTVNKILLPAWHGMICWFYKYRCQNNDYVSHLFHEWCSFVKTNITEVHNTVTRVYYMSMYSLCIHHTNLKHVTMNLLTRWNRENRKIMHALLKMWLHIICETRTDTSKQPAASIPRIFYPENVNSTLLRRQVHIHQIKTVSHPKAIIFTVTTADYNKLCCSRKLH
jgi:hypothetical protein